MGKLVRRAIAVSSCAASIMALVSGCGGASSSDSATNRASAKRLCPTVLAAEKRYTAATTAMSVRFYDKPLETRARRAIEALVPKVEELQRASVASQRSKLVPLVFALSNQLKTLKGFEKHDLAQVAKYGNSVNVPLRQGMKNLRAICGPGGEAPGEPEGAKLKGA
jgi:hypothetical protein